MSDQVDREGYLRNPAGRLYLFLKYVKESGVPNGQLLPVVTRYLDLPAQYTPTLFTALADLQSQPQLLREQVEALVEPPLPVPVLLEELPAAEAAIETIVPALQDQVQNARNRYTDGTLKSLQFTSHVLNNATGMKTPIPDNLLDDVRARAEDLIALLTEDDTLDPDLRKVLFTHADGVRRSVDLFKVSGLEAVLADFDRFLGMLRRQPQVIAEVKEKPTLLDRLQALLLALNIIAGAGNAAVAIGHGVEGLQELTQLPVSVVAPGDLSETEA